MQDTPLKRPTQNTSGSLPSPRATAAPTGRRQTTTPAESENRTQPCRTLRAKDPGRSRKAAATATLPPGEEQSTPGTTNACKEQRTFHRGTDEETEWGTSGARAPGRENAANRPRNPPTGLGGWEKPIYTILVQASRLEPKWLRVTDCGFRADRECRAHARLLTGNVSPAARHPNHPPPPPPALRAVPRAHRRGLRDGGKRKGRKGQDPIREAPYGRSMSTKNATAPRFAQPACPNGGYSSGPSDPPATCPLGASEGLKGKTHPIRPNHHTLLSPPDCPPVRDGGAGNEYASYSPPGYETGFAMRSLAT